MLVSIGINVIGRSNTFREVMELRINDLSFLDWSDISFTLANGEVVCLLGESGSGKSLLLRAIADLVVNEGEVFLAEESRSRMPATKWRRKVGYLPAEILWWEETIGEHFNTLPGHEDLEQLKLPKEIMDGSPSRLSMGERQRLGILRMLDREPSVLLLDEPTANLDEDSANVVEKRILSYLKQHSASALWVTHSSNQAKRIGNRILKLKDKALSAYDCEASTL